MSLNAAALRLLAEKGLSALDIAEVAEAMEVRRDNTAAERQQRRRDKLKTEGKTSRRDVTRDAPPIEEIITPLETHGDKSPSTPLTETAERIVNFWNDAIPGTKLPAARKLTADRLKHLRARLAEHSEADVIQAIRGMVGSDWHSGKSGQWTEGNIGWLLKSPENFTKMLERAPSVKAAAPAKSPDEWRAFCLNTAETMEKTGKLLDAEEWRRKAGVRVDRPPGNARAIGDLVSNVMQRVA